MSELQDTVQEAVEHARESRLNSVIAVLVAVTATFMALCSVKDGNIVQSMEQAQAHAVDEWSYYQAKGTKQNIAEQMTDQLEIERALLRNATPEERVLLDAKIKDYERRRKVYESEKALIKKDAERLQTEYDRLNFHDDQFDAAEACLSIAIALFGVTALTQKRWLLGFALVVAGFGIVLGLSGFLGLNFHPDFLARLLS